MVVHGLDAHGVELHGRVAGGGAVGGRHGNGAVGGHGIGGAVFVHGAAGCAAAVDVVVEIILCTGHIPGDEAGGGGSVVRVQHIGQCVHKVLRGDGAQHFAVAVHPVLIPQVEGPGQGVGVPLPAGGKAFANFAAAVVLHQRVDALGAVVQVRVGRTDQVVQGGGLAGIQHGVGGAVPGAAAAVRGRTAAAAQQAGGCHGKGGRAAALQELAAGDRMRHDKNPSFVNE